MPAVGTDFITLAATGPLPAEFPIPPGKTRFLTSEAMQAAAVFGKDTERVETPVNSMFEPRLYQFYRKGVLR